MSFPHFSLLAPELQCQVSAFLPPNDLLNLNLVSKRLNRLTTPWLYARISSLLEIYEPPSVHSPVQMDNGFAIRRAQRQLIGTLDAHPELARYIRDLNWHVFLDEAAPFPTQPYLRDLLPPLPDGLDKFDAFHASQTQPSPSNTRISGDVFDFFGKLGMVQRLHLDFSRGDIAAPFPERPFPRAHSIRLSGHINADITNSIIHTPSRLRELCLDHVFAPELNFLSNLFEDLTRRCDNLQRLSLLKGGNSRSDEPFDVSSEAATLSEFISFAASCASTLEHLKLALTPISHGIVLFGADLRPTHFAEFVMPLLLQNAAAWKSLRSLELEGIAVRSSDLEKLQFAFPRVIISLIPTRVLSEECAFDPSQEIRANEILR